MTYLPLPPFGVGGAVNATVSTVNADFGSGNSSATVANSPNYSTGETSTAEYLLTINNSNIGTEP
jgi:hypothetical protein